MGSEKNIAAIEQQEDYNYYFIVHYFFIAVITRETLILRVLVKPHKKKTTNHLQFYMTLKIIQVNSFVFSETRVLPTTVPHKQ